MKARPVIAAAGARLIEEPRVKRIVHARADRRSRPPRPGPGRLRDILGGAASRSTCARTSRGSSEARVRRCTARAARRSRHACAGSGRGRSIAVLRLVAYLAAAGRRRTGSRLGIFASRSRLCALRGAGAEPAMLAPAVLPGGLGAHKWRDRRLLDELAERIEAVRCSWIWTATSSRPLTGTSSSSRAPSRHSAARRPSASRHGLCPLALHPAREGLDARPARGGGRAAAWPLDPRPPSGPTGDGEEPRFHRRAPPPGAP